MIIFDCGSGNTCKNSVESAMFMVLEFAKLKVPGAVFKWQLFEKAGDNVPLNLEVFERASRYAGVLGYRTAASVFDKSSLDYAMTMNVPFIKLANNKAAHALLKDIPEAMPVVISTDDPEYKTDRPDTKIMYCISQYPADPKDYEKKFGDKLMIGMSDHTTDWTLFNKYQPKVYECHVKLRSSEGLDAGKFARTPEQVAEIMQWTKR